MRAPRIIVGVAALLVTVAGCGQGDPGASTLPGSASVRASTSVSRSLPSLAPSDLPAPSPVPSLPQGGTVLPKEQTDTGNLPPYYEKREVVVAPDGRSVTVWGMARDS